MSKKNDTGEKQDYMNLDWLNHQYYVLGRRIQEIADDQNVSMIRIRKWLAKLEEPIDMIFSPYCPYCGKHVKSHWKVCAYCGQRIRGMELYPIKEEALPKEEIVAEEPIKGEGLPKEEVVIEVKGGLIQSIVKSNNIKVVVVDYDVDPSGKTKDEWWGEKDECIISRM